VDSASGIGDLTVSWPGLAGGPGFHPVDGRPGDRARSGALGARTPDL